MQAILGARGVIGRELSRELASMGHRVRLVSRHPKAVHPSDEVVAADLLDAKATAAAVAGTTVAYLVAGLQYDVGVWQTQWPIVMRNAIAACQKHDAALVFLDNVYAYGHVSGPMTEETPFKPTSRKGEVRAAIARTLMDAVGRGELRGMIVRAADFYGPGATLSFTDAVVTKRLLAGKTPQWIGNPKALHTFSYTPDVAYSLARLGNIPSAYGQTWHALTSPEPMSGERYVRLACEVMGLPYRLQVAPRWMLSLMGVFNPVVRENMEMLYQFEHDYVFDSTKTVHALLREPTPYREGLAATLNREKGRSSPPPPS